MSVRDREGTPNGSTSLLWQILPSPPKPTIPPKKLETTDALMSATVADVHGSEKSIFRWVALFMTCFGMFAIYYCYDNPAALQNQMIDEFGLTNLQYNTLYSIYAFPNIIVPFFGGILTDVLGPRTTIIFFFVLVMTGQALFAFGASLDLFILMVIGRCLFGIGSETFGVAECPLIFSYFKDDELALALGLNLSFARIGSSVNDAVSVEIYQMFGIVTAFWAGLMLLGLGLLFLLFLISFHKKREIIFKHYLLTIKEHFANAVIAEATFAIDFPEPPSQQCAQYSTPNITPNMTPNLTPNFTPNMTPQMHTYEYSKDESLDFDYDFEKNFKNVNNIHVSDINDNENDNDNNHNKNERRQSRETTKHHKKHKHKHKHNRENKQSHHHRHRHKHKERQKHSKKMKKKKSSFRCSDLTKFDICFWLLTLNCGLIYGCISPWMNIGSSYLQSRYGFDHDTGNTLLMIPYMIAAVFTSLFGYIVDKYGRRAQLLLVSSISLVFAHSILGYVNYTPQWDSINNSNDDMNSNIFYKMPYMHEILVLFFPICALIALGIAFSIFCAVIWPSFALVVDQSRVGTAYGIPSAFYNGMMAILYLVVGSLTKASEGCDKYDNVETFLLSLSILTVLTGITLMYFDFKTGHRLNQVTSKDNNETQNENNKNTNGSTINNNNSYNNRNKTNNNNNNNSTNGRITPRMAGVITVIETKNGNHSPRMIMHPRSLNSDTTAMMNGQKMSPRMQLINTNQSPNINAYGACD